MRAHDVRRRLTTPLGAPACLTDLPLRGAVSASHRLCDLTLGRPSVVHHCMEDA